MSRDGPHLREIVPPRSRYSDSGRFGRMFGDLPSFAVDTPDIRAALIDIGRPRGIMDARDEAASDGATMRNSDNPASAAGFAFLGQFLGHDMTFDATSSLERQADPEQLVNFRTPSLGLDNVYGAGPGVQPQLFDKAPGQSGKFLVEPIGTKGKFDLPRNSQNIALIADPRDDENLITAQLHLAFLKFHNEIVDQVTRNAKTDTPNEIFSEAQQIVRWHYQWIVINEYLRCTCGDAVVESVLREGRKFYRWNNEPFIPVEFSAAAFRFRDSQIRPVYRANIDGDRGNPFAAVLFGSAPTKPADPDDLSGSVRAPRRFVDWRNFFDFGDGHVVPNKKIGTRLSTSLFRLPRIFVPGPDLKANPVSLAQRALLRHLSFSLPSGQRIARAMRLPELSKSDLSDLKPYGLDDRTPLWFYILREAQLVQNGERLGPVGGRIVAEVVLGLMEGDRSSFLSQDPEWRPFLPTIDPAMSGEDFRMVDLLRIAKVA